MEKDRITVFIYNFVIAIMFHSFQQQTVNLPDSYLLSKFVSDLQYLQKLETNAIKSTENARQSWRYLQCLNLVQIMSNSEACWPDACGKTLKFICIICKKNICNADKNLAGGWNIDWCLYIKLNPTTFSATNVVGKTERPSLIV